MIDRFADKYDFLSNFYNTPVEYQGIKYNNSESAYQAMKTLNIDERKLFTNITAFEAKKLGRKISLRDDWDNVKLDIMYEIVYAKFTQNDYIKYLLLDTGDEELIEGNYWHDTFWGICNGIGENHLGKILMKIREELKNS